MHLPANWPLLTYPAGAQNPQSTARKGWVAPGHVVAISLCSALFGALVTVVAVMIYNRRHYQRFQEPTAQIHITQGELHTMQTTAAHMIPRCCGFWAMRVVCMHDTRLAGTMLRNLYLQLVHHHRRCIHQRAQGLGQECSNHEPMHDWALGWHQYD